ncbi:hypothetical protein [Streptomyces sp. NRRL S-1813]|nr:hypothetical protein [Streptomyces sp. NRRL S-1813]
MAGTEAAAARVRNDEKSPAAETSAALFGDASRPAGTRPRSAADAR